MFNLELLNLEKKANGLLSGNQYGFRKTRRSVEDQLLLTYAEVANRVDSGSVVDMIFLDFSKAFDVNHSILIKLQMLGVGGHLLLWIWNFLIGHTICVRVASQTSEPIAVTSGVPQGSVLGPILFLIYVNCIAASLECHWKTFADDFKIYLSFPMDSCISVFQGMVQLQRGSDMVCSVAKSWNLCLNVNKCVAMRFSAQKSEEIPPFYDIAGKFLEFVSVHRDLGVLVDSRLRFHEYIREVVQKAGGLAGELLRSTVCRSPVFMVSLFVSYIRPVMDFCSSIWNVGTWVMSDCWSLFREDGQERFLGFDNSPMLRD